MSVSIDGFVGGPNGESDWIFKSSTAESRTWAVEQSWDASLIIMGRKSFEVMAPFYPTATIPFAPPMNEIPKGVFTKSGFKPSALIDGSQSEAAASWANSQVFNGDLAEEITKLKEGSGKPIVAIAGAGFMHNLIATGLIDEYLLSTHPVILGKGLSIFDGAGAPIDLKLLEVKSFEGGVVVRRYGGERKVNCVKKIF